MSGGESSASAGALLHSPLATDPRWSSVICPRSRSHCDAKLYGA